MLAVVARGGLQPPASVSFAERLVHIANGLASLVERHRPSEAAIEDLFHAVNTRSVLQLAHVRGAIVLELARRGIPLFAYAPRTVKMAVTGVGSADKSQVRNMVQRLLRVDLRGDADDVSDALAVAICHAHSRRGKRP